MKVQSTQSARFSTVPAAEIPRSSFDRSHGGKTTFDAGYLVPIFIDEMVPGDTFNLNMTAFARLATPIHPFMDNMFMDTFYFAVPYRLIFDNWEKLQGAQDNPGDSTDFLVPTMAAPATVGHLNGSLSDYFAIPTDIADLEHISLFHRAYNLIYNEWFRDENLQNSVVVDKDDGPDDPTDYTLLRRGKRHDYFTSCLPFPQKGPAVDLPLGGNAPVIGIGVDTGNPSAGFSNVDINVRETGNVAATYSDRWASSTSGLYIDADGPASATASPAIYADLTNVSAATINQLREAFQIQKLYERDARGGTRYTEMILAHFGVKSPDMRMQRPEYLGGGSSPINVNPIAQTSSTDGTSPQGNLSAFATTTLNNHGFTYSATEHCVVIGLVSARADLTYQQGLARMFSRSTRWDFYMPALAHLGEQAVLQKEIYADGIPANDDIVFGYQQRFAEMRYKPSTITGQFRSNFTTPLDTWHLAQDFASAPTLNNDFIVENPPVDRVIAVTSEPHFLWDSYFSFKCARPMPVDSVPGLIDHF